MQIVGFCNRHSLFVMTALSACLAAACKQPLDNLAMNPSAWNVADDAIQLWAFRTSSGVDATHGRWGCNA